MARHTNGWVKIERRAALGDINSNFARGGMFLALIAMANIQPSMIEWKGMPRKLVRGEILTTLTELSTLGNVDRKTISKHLQYLVRRETISLEKTNNGIIIKFINFEEYNALAAEWSQPSPNEMDDGMDNAMDDGVPHNKELKNKRNKELKKRESKSDKSDALPRLAVLWNEHSGELSKVTKTNSSRNRLCEIRFKEDSEDEWIRTIKRIASSDFCLGKSDRGWMATFDWLLKPETRLKVLEGKYDNPSVKKNDDLFAFIRDDQAESA